MFEGFYTSMEYEPFADSRLRHPASQSKAIYNYVKTGNVYGANYSKYKNQIRKDTFVKNQSNNKKTSKILGKVAILAGLLGAGFLAGKYGKVPDAIKSLPDKIKINPDSIKGFFSKCGDFAKEIVDKAKTRIRR